MIDNSLLVSGANGKDQERKLIAQLKEMKAEDIIGFEMLLRKLLIVADDYGIMAAAKIIEGWVSDDSYLYFRCWLISKGKEVYEKALENPDTLAASIEKGEDSSFEELLYVATEAYFHITGKEDEDETFPRSIAIEHGLDYDFGDFLTNGTDWTEDQLPKLYPALCQKFGNISH